MGYAKKSLGQHFLKSAKALRSLVQAPCLLPADTVLEIGPGRGALTKALLETGAHVVAVETDLSLMPLLEETFANALSQKQLTLVHADIRTWDRSLIASAPYKVVANIPYYITGEIIRMFLETPHQPESMTLLVQKEVCDRIVARDKKQSILSLSVKAYGTPVYIEKVPARDFSPPPKVDSAILHVHTISKAFFETLSEEDFFRVVKVGFSSKRKKLSNNLRNVWEVAKVAEALMHAQVPQDVRPEDVPLVAWRLIALHLLRTRS